MFANAAAAKNVSTVKSYTKDAIRSEQFKNGLFFMSLQLMNHKLKKSYNKILTFAEKKYGSAFKIKMRLLVP